MDQAKIGKFIADCRREQGLTNRHLLHMEVVIGYVCSISFMVLILRQALP